MALIGFTVKRDEILRGEKRCTTRLARKRPPRLGETLYLYWKLRTKDCRLLGTAICEMCLPVTWTGLLSIINFPEDGTGYLKQEGFSSKEEAVNWFQGHYKPTSETLFHIIGWKDFKRAEGGL